MAVRVAEVCAPAVVTAVDLASLLAGGVGEVGDAALLDAPEDDVELLLGDLERVVVRVEGLLLEVVQGDPVGQRDRREPRDRRVDGQVQQAGPTPID